MARRRVSARFPRGAAIAWAPCPAGAAPRQPLAMQTQEMLRDSASTSQRMHQPLWGRRQEIFFSFFLIKALQLTFASRAEEAQAA